MHRRNLGDRPVRGGDGETPCPPWLPGWEYQDYETKIVADLVVYSDRPFAARSLDSEARLVNFHSKMMIIVLLLATASMVRKLDLQ